MRKVNWKVPLFIIFIFLFAIGLSYLVLNEKKETDKDTVKMSIALVNEDDGHPLMSNLYSMAELGKIPNKDLVKILKSIRNNPLHPWKAIESAFPYKLDQKPIKNGNIKITTDVSKNTMKSMFDETFKSKEYRRFLQKKNAPKKLNKYKYIGLQGAKGFAKKSIGKNPFEALSNDDAGRSHSV